MKKQIGIAVGAVLAAAVVCGGLFGVPKAVQSYKYHVAYPKKYTLTQEKFDGANGSDRIHFLKTGSSDAILLESDGRFALVDGGEDTDNPRGLPGLELPGYEQAVLQYLKKVAAGPDGKVELDFIVGTHAHSDHLGGLDTILADEAVNVHKAYLKPYDAARIAENEVREWDNQEVYDQTVQALEEKGVPIVSSIPDEPFSFGQFTCQFYNTQPYTGAEKRGENENSLGLLLRCNGASAFLAGDINNYDAAEDVIGPQIGPVDLLKFGHHGYEGSTSTAFVSALMPKIGILTSNGINSLHAQAQKDVVRISQTAVYCTAENNGLIAYFTPQGIVLTNQIME